MKLLVRMDEGIESISLRTAIMEADDKLGALLKVPPLRPV